MPNLFTNPQVVTAKETSPKKPKRIEINIAGMEKVAAIDMLIKSLLTLKETEQSSVKAIVKDEFVETGCKLKRRPENFRGTEGLGSASCELRIRPSSSALSEEEQMLFLENQLPMQTVTLVEECYRVNPEYSENQDLLARVSKQIEKLKDVPADFIQLQAGSSRTVVGESAMDILFTKPEVTVRQMLEMVGIIVLKPKFEDGNLDRALEIAKPLLSLTEVIARGEAAEVKVAAPAKAPRKRAA